MRVLLVCHYLPPHEGGIERVVGRLADGYAAAGWSPVLVGWGDASAAQAATRHRVVSLPGRNPLERVGVPVPLLDPVRTSRILRRELVRADALHIHGLPYIASMLALLATRRAGTPTVVTEHVGSIPYERRSLRTVQAVALSTALALARRSATAVTVLNDRVADELRPRLGTVPVVKIPNGVDATRFSPASEDERARLRAELGLSGPTVVSVGRNVPKKGFRHVVAAARTSSFDVVLVGAGTTALADPPRVVAVEGMGQDQLADLYRAVDALVLASEGEGLPLVVQEALASGLPVVMGDDPAVRAELPEEPIRFVPPADLDAFRTAIEEVLDGRTRRLLAQSARAEALARFDWDASVERYLTLFGKARSRR